MITRVPTQENPELIDKLFANLQEGLTEQLSWLDVAFGRAERLTKYTPEGKRIYTANLYAGGNEYMEVAPDSNIGNFSFFWVDDPQQVGWLEKVSITINCPFSLIFWFDMRTVFDSANVRNKEQIKREILDVLNGRIWIKAGHIQINRIYELAENIFKGFSLDEIDNQFLMQPFCGFRFEGELSITETCGNIIN